MYFYCHITDSLIGSSGCSPASETMPRIGRTIHSRCLDSLFQFCHKMRMCQGLLSLKRKKGPGPGPRPGPGPVPLRDMNLRTAATGHISLSILPTKVFASTLKGSVLDAFIRTQLTCGFSVQSTEISSNVSATPRQDLNLLELLVLQT